MSFLNTLASLATGTQGGAMSLIPVLLEQVKKYPGGIDGLVENFKQQGLGPIIASWIGTGPNLPVSGEQLQSVLGTQVVDDIAQNSGQERDTVLGTLAQLLPQLIDKASPDGQLPAGGNLGAGALMGALSGLLGQRS